MKPAARFLFIDISILIILALCFCFAMLSCKKENDSHEIGRYSLFSADGNCSNIGIEGTAFTSIGLEDSNMVVMHVRASRSGTYNINTDTVNGMYFQGAGVLTTSHLNTVYLTGNGIPESKRTTTFSLKSSDGSGCKFDINVEDYIDSLEFGWQFFDNGVFHKGQVDSSHYENHVTGDAFYIEGMETSATASIFGIGLYSEYGTMTSPQFDLEAVTIFYRVQGENLLWDQSQFTVKVDSYNRDTRIVKGRFAGRVLNSNGAVEHEITDGRFRARLEHITINPPPDF